MLTFNKRYFIISTFLFLIEVLIATVFKNERFIRAYLGDVIVVGLLYTFVLTFTNVKNKKSAILGVLVFSFGIEILQYFHIGERIGLKDHKLAMIVIGNSFSWIDMACYMAGCMIIWLMDVQYNKVFNVSTHTP